MPEFDRPKGRDNPGLARAGIRMIDALPFGSATRAWFRGRFAAPTPVQQRGIAAIAAGHHALLLAPTGSGKTLAGFLWSIDRCLHSAAPLTAGVRILYISPLKALAYDIERNLADPLREISELAAASPTPARDVRVGVRTGDTSDRDRRRIATHPPDILVTTPESLYLMLGSRARSVLTTVETVLVDEIHALAGTKRGAHLVLSLERLSAQCLRDPQRIGLSATARPADRIAAFLGGDRPVTIVDTSAKPRLELTVAMASDAAEDATATEPKKSPIGVWPGLIDRLLREIEQHRTTIVFVNSRGLCERLARQLNDALDSQRAEAEPCPSDRLPPIATHHGSLSPERRRAAELALKEGHLRCIVATSSLELGIDIATVDRVVLVESPGSVSRGLQRVGRSDHRVDGISRGLILPKHRGDLLEATVVAGLMREGAIEPLSGPKCALDVLAQQVVARVATEGTTVEALLRSFERADGYRDLTRELLTPVLDLLSGHYPSTDFAELVPRIVWDRRTDQLAARPGAGSVALVNGGTIPDRGLYPVYHGRPGPRVGELDEEMVNESRPGDVLALGATSWRVLSIDRDRVVVEPAPGMVGQLPFWRGDGPGRPLMVGRALGQFVRTLSTKEGEAAERWLATGYGLEPSACRHLVNYIREQVAATQTVPSDRTVVVERFRDEVGDWRIAILSPFGSRVHAPWALAIQAGLSDLAGFEVLSTWTDDGIMLRLASGDAQIAQDILIPDPVRVEELIVQQLSGSSLFASQFREAAARALLLPRRRPGQRTPLWTQRLRAQALLGVARTHRSFPILLEAYRSCLDDVFDRAALREILGSLHAGHITLHSVTTDRPSPFARSLSLAFTAAHLYESDTPTAERRVHALELDRELLQELLGSDELRQLLDRTSLDEIENELQRRDIAWRAHSLEGVHDLLRRLGPLDDAEIAERCEGSAHDWIAQLESDGRATRIELATRRVLIATEDAALFRDGLGVALPSGVPEAFTNARPDPLRQILTRWARQRGPFLVVEAARAFALDLEVARNLLEQLVRSERLLAGGFRPDGHDREYCDPDVLRRVEQRSLARARREIEPVDGATAMRFAIDWHRLHHPPAGIERLLEVLEQLQGYPMSLVDMEARILPQRIAGFRPRLLDEALAFGTFVWVAHAPLGKHDARIAFHRRDSVASLADPVRLPDPLPPLEAAILQLLQERGACFQMEVVAALGSWPIRQVGSALLTLAFASAITNDTLQPIRSRGRSGTRNSWTSPGAGRWALTVPVRSEGPREPDVAEVRAEVLLRRHGIVGRRTLDAESWSGGYAPIYRALRALEQAGRVRRGHFVEGLGGAQFALPGAVDRLRRALPGDTSRVVTLAAADPAQPYGAAFEWPRSRAGAEAAPRRVPGALVLFIEGRVALYIRAGSFSVVTFEPMSDDANALEVLRHLERELTRGQRRLVRIPTVDGVPARQSPDLERFRRAGFQLDGDALMPRP